MAAVGSLVFCTECGNLLDETEGRQNAKLQCNVCGALCEDNASKVIVTYSKPSAYPSTLRAKHSDVQQVSDADRVRMAVIEQTCDKCGREEVKWYEQQLRSADEGTTIFYVCDCGNRWTQNN